MGSEFTGEMRKSDNLKSAPAVTYGVNGKVKQADNTKVKGPKTSYVDRVSKSTVKRAS